MCGICEYFSTEPVDVETIQHMSDVIVHRGPDDEGFLFGGAVNGEIDGHRDSFVECGVNFAFGHRRLAIQDFSSAARQPMFCQDRYWIVFNGEIYNFFELRKRLAAEGYTFRSRTDTEVISATYDRFGINPLYYYLDDGNFVFASEIKSLLQHRLVAEQTGADPVWCRRYLRHGPREWARETRFKHIFRLPFSSGYEVSLKERFARPMRGQRYWCISPNSDPVLPPVERSTENDDERYRALLRDSVALRLRADVPIGTALSGGLDSSSIVVAINRELEKAGVSERQRTFSTVFRARETFYCDESEYIDELTETLRVEANAIEPAVEDVPGAHRQTMWYMDTPPEGTCMSGWYTFKCVREAGVTVTLDGQGADEQLAGYLRYLRHPFMELPMGDLLREYGKFVQTPKACWSSITGCAFNSARRILTRKGLNRFLRYFGKAFDATLAPNELLLRDVGTSLVNMIHYSDRFSMAHSVESRMPYMNYRMGASRRLFAC